MNFSAKVIFIIHFISVKEDKLPGFLDELYRKCIRHIHWSVRCTLHSKFNKISNLIVFNSIKLDNWKSHHLHCPLHYIAWTNSVIMQHFSYFLIENLSLIKTFMWTQFLNWLMKLFFFLKKPIIWSLKLWSKFYRHRWSCDRVIAPNIQKIEPIFFHRWIRAFIEN